MWARTAANASHGPEQLQMLQLSYKNKIGGSMELCRRDIYTKLPANSHLLWARTAANASRWLQLQKQEGGRALQKDLATNSQSEQLQMIHVG